MKRKLAGVIAGLGLTASALGAAAGPATAAPPDNKVTVEVTCEGLGTFEARVPNGRAVLDLGATMATRQSEVGVGVVFDLFDLFEGGRANAPVVDGRGFANRLLPCTSDLSPFGGPAAVPIGILATGQVMKNLP